MNIDHENTVRTLKDESPIVNSFWCRFGIHRWTFWLKPQWLKDEYALKCLFQTKHCIHCGIVKKTKISGIIG